MLFTCMCNVRWMEAQLRGALPAVLRCECDASVMRLLARDAMRCDAMWCDMFAVRRVGITWRVTCFCGDAAMLLIDGDD